MKVNLIDSFRDFTEYRDWIKKSYAGLSSLNLPRKVSLSEPWFNARGAKAASWYGTTVTFAELEAGIDSYAKPDLLRKMLAKMEDETAAYMTMAAQRKKMRFNDLGLGVFSFDRAAMGLYRVKEYYSPLHARLVQEHETRLEHGRRSMASDGSEIVERWEQRPDGMPKGRTSTQKIFAFFPKPKRDISAVSIVVSSGGSSNVEAKDFLYSGLAAITLARLLERAGIRTSIEVLFGSLNMFDEDAKGLEFHGCLVPLKRLDEPIDSDLIAMATSDPRFFRFEGFKAVISAYDHFGSTIRKSLGFPPSRKVVEAVVAERKNALVDPENVVCIENCFSEEAAIRVVKETMEKLATTAR